MPSVSAAVKLQYINQEKRDTIAVRLAGMKDPTNREAETVKAKRRFWALGAPLTLNLRVQAKCKTFTKKTKRGQ